MTDLPLYHGADQSIRYFDLAKGGRDTGRSEVGSFGIFLRTILPFMKSILKLATCLYHKGNES